MTKLTSDDMSELIGKTIMNIKEDLDGILILFTDGTLIELSTSMYPDGSFECSYIKVNDEMSDFEQKLKLLKIDNIEVENNVMSKL